MGKMEQSTGLTNHNVYKSNELIEASYRLNLEEQRLLLISIAKLDSRPEGNHNIVVIIDAKEYAETFGIDTRSAYQQLRQATDRLYERDIKFKAKDGRSLTRIRWVSSVRYAFNEGHVSLCFSQEVKPFLTTLRKQFTGYRLRHVAGLKSTYSIRIYELLMQNKMASRQGRRVELGDLKDMLGIDPAHYKRFVDFKRRVLDLAVDELNKKSDISISYETEKRGRRVAAIILMAKDKPQQELDLQ